MRAAITAVFVVVILLVALEPFIKGRITGLAIQSEDEFNYTIHFCSETNCLHIIKQMINASKSECAMYNFEQGMGKVDLVTDNNYKEDIEAVKDNRSGLMHNKFCVFNGTTILTGSFNIRSSPNDQNNLIIIKSRQLSRNYEDEFRELHSGTFGSGKKTARTEIYLNGTKIENYFCPEDECAQHVINALHKAKSSIHFMAYSFTHKGIANELVIKGQEMEVSGIIDRSSDKKVFELLKEQNISVKLYRKKGIMHQKVFIIDNDTVITGSFNPTYSADQKNDENLLIIHNKQVAQRYMEEFERVME